jgi:hypothetical protein
MFQVLVVCKDCEGLHTVQFSIPLFQTMNDSKQFLVMDVIVALSWEVLLGEVGTGPQVVIVVILR